MSQRIYTVVFENVTVAAAQDLIAIKAGAGGGIEVHHIMMSAGGVTAAAEIRLRLRRLTGTVTLGTVGGGAFTPLAIDDNDPSSSATAHINDTTQATGTAITTLRAWQWNVLGMFEHLPVPEQRDRCKASEGFTIDVVGTPASTVVSGFFVYEDLT